MRRLSAAPAAILAAFTDTKKLAAWWGPKGFRNTFETCEPKPGGQWKFVMHAPDGADYKNESEFVELGTERIVIDHLRPMHRFRLTVLLQADGDGTLVTWRQKFDTAAEADRIRQFVQPANEQNLDRLAAVLAGKSPE
ncbi:MAG: SRPBCC domain-containing protein [Pirellulales bacterium]